MQKFNNKVELLKFKQISIEKYSIEKLVSLMKAVYYLKSKE